MPPLPRDLRRQLENAIVAARPIAELGAKNALEALAVGLAKPHASMNDAQKSLRNRLRAHGRQLGDALDRTDDTQSIKRLTREVAYEHWHRMLFARFLAENNLLVEPDSGVAMTLAECTDLARDKHEDPWTFAARCAERMLPAIFRSDDPALAVALPPETRQTLEQLVADLQSVVFTADDALGWTYQFWQKLEKDAVNKSGDKITGETLPAVTQLFTEHYMVLFLLHNTLGAWHAAKVLSLRPELATNSTSESELRRAVALDGCAWEYLRFVRTPRAGDAEGSPGGPWRPAAGPFATWPRNAADLKVLDPCCGSGHFLVAALEILVHLRMAEEHLVLEPAIVAVLRDNLFGLELDARCTQIAAFNLALAAWRWAGKTIDLPQLQLACCGLGPETSKDEWLALAESAAAAGGMPVKKKDLFVREESLLSSQMRYGFEALHELFARAPELGSLIDPSSITGAGPLHTANFETLEPIFARMLESSDDVLRERAVAARGMARAARILVGPSGGYTLVVTNVPYLGRKSHTDELKEWIDANYKDAKNDLATVFVARMLRWVGKSGTVAAVTPQNWLFLTGYKKLRGKLLTDRTWDVVVRLGEHAFESSAAAGAFAAMAVISGRKSDETHIMSGIDVSAPRGQRPIYSEEKATLLRGEPISATEPNPNGADSIEPVPEVSASAPLDDLDESPTPDSSSPADGSVRLIQQSDQLKNPDARITLSAARARFHLKDIAGGWQGIASSDFLRFGRFFWELPSLLDGWRFEQSTVETTLEFGAREHILYWQDGNGAMTEVCQEGATFRGKEAWGKCGIAVAQMGGLPVTLYAGDLLDNNTAAIVPGDRAHVPAIWAFCSSTEFAPAVRRIDQKLNVTNATLVKVPFDHARWQRVAAEHYPSGLPEPQSNDPTQWLFHGHPVAMLAAGPASCSALGIADPVGHDRHASLICREPDPLDVLQVAVARLLGYRWPAELDEEMELDVAVRAWATKCRDLDRFADEDGIVCIPSVRGEPTAAERARRLLAAAFADFPGVWSAARERELLAAAAGDEKPADSLEDWLIDDFFAQHSALFHSRPFVWHVWDGRRDGFNALVNCHRLTGPEGEGRRTLEALAFTYLGEWIDRQRAEQSEGREGADGRLAAALKLQGELKKILVGEPPYDVFVRWKPLHEQALGWEPDINDGVRLNTRPFLLAADVGRKGCGVLRARPKSLKWDKDRGKEPRSLRPREQFPWFWGCDPENEPAHRVDFGAGTKGAVAAKEFDGARWNELHYTRAAKEAARARMAQAVKR